MVMMQNRRNDGVSPVIAVILILMLTVLLVGIIGALFMGMSSDTVEGMNTSFLQPKHEWEGVVKLVYNGNGNDGGEVPVDEGTHEAGDIVAVAAGSKMYRLGHTFASWNTNATGFGEGYLDNDSLTLNAYTVLYAQWNKDPDRYYVIYEENREGATLPTSHACAKENETIELIGALPADEFAGWKDKNGIFYAKGDTYDGANGDLELYAQWKDDNSTES